MYTENKRGKYSLIGLCHCRWKITQRFFWHCGVSWIRRLIDALRSASFVLLYLMSSPWALLYIAARSKYAVIKLPFCDMWFNLLQTQSKTFNKARWWTFAGSLVHVEELILGFFDWIWVDTERWLPKEKSCYLMIQILSIHDECVTLRQFKSLLSFNNTFLSLCFMRGAISFLQSRLASMCVRGRKGKQSNQNIISSLWIREPHLQLIHGQVGFVRRVQCRVCSTNAL